MDAKALSRKRGARGALPLVKDPASAERGNPKGYALSTPSQAEGIAEGVALTDSGARQAVRNSLVVRRKTVQLLLGSLV